MKKAITHLKLSQANSGKLQELDELASEHQRVVQAYVDWLIQRQVRQPSKYAAIPEQDVPTLLSEAANVALERLSVKDMRFKSRQMNRALRASQLGYARDKLKFKLDERGIRYRSVQPAYSSQQCSRCGFTLPLNRRSQAEFRCLWCGFAANADENAAQNIAERFGDDELNTLSFREAETVLALRFMRRLPVARSATARLELQPEIWLPRGKVVVPREPAKWALGVAALEPLPTVNQPGQDPCHSCL